MLKQVNRTAESILEGLGISKEQLDALNAKLETYIKNMVDKIDVNKEEEGFVINRLDILADLSEQFSLEETLLLASSTIADTVQQLVHIKAMQAAQAELKALIDNLPSGEPQEEIVAATEVEATVEEKHGTDQD